MFDGTLRLMDIAVFFLVLDYLAVEFVGEAVNRCIHVGIFSLNKNILAAQVNIGFHDVFEFFHSHDDVDVDDMIEVGV